MAHAIQIEGVSKRFRLYHEQYSSLKERVIHFGKIPYDDFWALKDVSFDIDEGQSIGILGHNGSGKSTLLKCMAGILTPTSGQIKVRGRMAALLELGAGFHPDLTGRENVFMNATLLGLNQKEIERKFDEIVSFAELENFIDNQVKYYSSGMYVRLGFAVAVNMDPDILLVDEVLAVGDENFQRKCIEKVRSFQREGRTIVVVSHSADQIRAICDSAVVLDHGLKVAEGTPGEAIRSLREHLRKRGVDEPEMATVAPEVELTHGEAQKAKATGTVKIVDVNMGYPAGRNHLLPGEPLDIEMVYEAEGTVDDVVIGIAVHDLEGRVIFGMNTRTLGADIAPLEGKGTIRFAFPSIPLLDGDYLLTVGAHTTDEGTVYDWHDQEHSFAVLNPGHAAGLVYAPAQVIVQRHSAATNKGRESA